MRLSRLFGRTLRETPSDAELPSHRLLVRAGMIRRASQASGMFTCLPLAQRALGKIQRTVRDEMDALGGQEVDMPLVQPAELWQQSGRWQSLSGKELLSLRDRNERELVLAITHEEAVTDLVRHEIRSYRQLPLMLYQIKLKFRDELRPRGGLIRVREFLMKDGYSFHASQADLDAYYGQVSEAYFRIFAKCGLETLCVESDTGAIGGSGAHEFMLPTPSGEDTLFLCDHCGYAANRDIAQFDKGQANSGPSQPLEPVETPDQTTIDQVARFLDIPTRQTLKAVFYSTGDEVVFVGIRGDLEVNETKLAGVLGAPEVAIATEDEVAAQQLVAGYASPVGIDHVRVVVDDSVPSATNLVAGANRSGYHLRNVNYGRDFSAEHIADIAEARRGDDCVQCGSPLRVTRGIEVGNIFKLGTKYSEAMGATYLDADGVEQPLVMGCYGIGMGRLLACIVEANHDEDGIVWPISVAPYPVHLLHLGRSPEVISEAENLCSDLMDQGLEVLYDDRNESPGVKFKDADLMGMPIRITVSERCLKTGSVELKYRHEKEKHTIPRDALDLKARVESLHQRLQQRGERHVP